MSDLYEHIAEMLRRMDGGVIGVGSTDKTWVFWPEDCTCEPAPDDETTTHSAACPFFDDRLLAVVTVELPEDPDD